MDLLIHDPKLILEKKPNQFKDTVDSNFGIICIWTPWILYFV